MIRGGDYFTFEKRAGDNAWLDLVRAIAIGLVLARHGYRAIAAPSDAVAPWQAFLLNGWVGVDLFFVLSGYLISQHLLRHGIGTGRFELGRYLAVRALRIVPAYLAVMGLIVASAFPFYVIDGNFLAVRVGYHLLFLQDYLPSNINVVFWSLGVEEKFYLIAPVLVWFALSRGSLAGSLSVVLCLFALSPLCRAAAYMLQAGPLSYETFFQLLRSPFHMTLEPIMIGVAIAIAGHAGAFASSPQRGARLMAIAAVALAAFLASGNFMGFIDSFDVIAQPPIIACLCGLLTLGAVMMGHARLPLEMPVRVVARLSYSLYLVHYPLLPFAMVIATSGEYPGPLFWTAYLGLSAACACLLHFSVEKPFLVLKNKLASNGRLAQAARG
jgi:peptidoglycan/LPS O-acetylase OafA/YrhL